MLNWRKQWEQNTKLIQKQSVQNLAQSSCYPAVPASTGTKGLQEFLLQLEEFSKINKNSVKEQHSYGTRTHLWLCIPLHKPSSLQSSTLTSEFLSLAKRTHFLFQHPSSSHPNDMKQILLPSLFLCSLHKVLLTYIQCCSSESFPYTWTSWELTSSFSRREAAD